MSITSAEQDLHRRIEAALPGVTPGVCVRAYQGGELLRDLRVGETFRTYDLASLTKLVFTQQAMMQAFEQGQWNLGSTVADILADYPEKQVTIRELLTHSSGIEWWKPFYQSVPPDVGWQQKRRWLYGQLQQSEFQRTGKSVYSDLGFMLLGFVLEALSGRDLLEHWNEIRSRVYPRATLAFHIDNRTNVPLDQFAPTEDCPWRQRVLRGEVHDDNTHALGGVSTHAGLFGSIEDLSVFGLNLRAQLRGTDSRFVSQQTAQWFARRAVPRATGDWALGFMLPSAEGASCGRHFADTSIGHTGFTGTSFWYDIVRDRMVLILSNRVHYGRDNKAFLQLRPQIHDWVVESLQA